MHSTFVIFHFFKIQTVGKGEWDIIVHPNLSGVYILHGLALSWRNKNSDLVDHFSHLLFFNTFIQCQTIFTFTVLSPSILCRQPQLAHLLSSRIYHLLLNHVWSIAVISPHALGPKSSGLSWNCCWPAECQQPIIICSTSTVSKSLLIMESQGTWTCFHLMQMLACR